MMLESIYIGMPVCHKDSSNHMTVKHILRSGFIVCEFIAPDGERVEQLFLPSELEKGVLKVGRILLAGL
nr:hypothetical protein [uncultured bacterium]